MPTIKIWREHSLGLDGMRAKFQEYADKLGPQYGVTLWWQGDKLYFERAEVNGHVEVADAYFDLRINVPFYLYPMKPVIEREIDKKLKKMQP